MLYLDFFRLFIWKYFFLMFNYNIISHLIRPIFGRRAKRHSQPREWDGKCKQRKMCAAYSQFRFVYVCNAASAALLRLFLIFCWNRIDVQISQSGLQNRFQFREKFHFEACILCESEAVGEKDANKSQQLPLLNVVYIISMCEWMLCVWLRTQNHQTLNFIESGEREKKTHSITIGCEVRAEKKNKFIDEVPFVNAEHELF